jgi:hypothetical protein
MSKPNPSDTIVLGGSNVKPTENCTVSGYATEALNGCSPYGDVSKINPGFSGWIKQFQYWPSSTDPQTIYNIYRQSVGSDMFGNFFGNYGLSISLTNNGVAQNTISV